MSTIAQMMDALASVLANELCGTANPEPIPDLQVDARLNPYPTPPSIDVFPASEFTDQMTFGRGQREYYFTVRARVSTADNEGGQELLLSMMDDESTASVESAILQNKGLGGVANVKTVEGPSEYGIFVDMLSQPPRQWLGCTWRVRVIP